MRLNYFMGSVKFGIVLVVTGLFACMSYAAAHELPYTSKDLSNALEVGDIDWIRLMLEQNPSLANEPCDGTSPLLHAVASNKSVKIIELLLEKEAFADTEEYSNTVLQYAVYNENLDAVRLLLRFGASVNKKNCSDGDTALHIATRIGSLEIAKILVEAGALPHIKNNQWKTPLHEAAGQFDAIKLLVASIAGEPPQPLAFFAALKLEQLGAKPSKRSAGTKRKRLLALCPVCSNKAHFCTSCHARHADFSLEGKNFTETDSELAKARALLNLVNAQDRHGWTILHHVLHYSAAKAARQAIPFLLSMGADTELRDRDGQRPLDRAVEYGLWEDVQQLSGGREM